MVMWRYGVAVLGLLVGISAPARAQVELSGEWRVLAHETSIDGAVRPGDYTGLPLNNEGRLAADAWDGSVLSIPEFQCRPHALPFAEGVRNPGTSQFRWWKEIEPVTQTTVAYRKRGVWMEPERTIWMDGRAHPPAYAPHTWLGFSTGEWVGATLKITTTHIKEGYLRRNGVPVSDRTTMTEYMVRHGSLLTSTVHVVDPVYLAEPYVYTSTWVLDPGVADAVQGRYPCGPNQVVVEVIRPKDEVPHYLPGANQMLRELAEQTGLPFEATRGGAETLYPEYVQKIKALQAAPAAR